MLSWVHSVFIQNPLRSLYFSGPDVLGFWGGADLVDICASLTTTSAAFWSQHYSECVDVCEKRFTAFSTSINFVIYILILLRVVNALVFHFCFTRPVMSELRTLIRNK